MNKSIETFESRIYNIIERKTFENCKIVGSNVVLGGQTSTTRSNMIQHVGFIIQQNEHVHFVGCSIQHVGSCWIVLQHRKTSMSNEHNIESNIVGSMLDPLLRSFSPYLRLLF